MTTIIVNTWRRHKRNATLTRTVQTGGRRNWREAEEDPPPHQEDVEEEEEEEEEQAEEEEKYSRLPASIGQVKSEF